MKLSSFVQSRYSQFVVLGTSIISGSAFADDTGKSGLTQLTDAIDFGDVKTAMIAIAVVLIGIYSFKFGIKQVSGEVKKA